jgi:hypothetical protein
MKILPVIYKSSPKAWMICDTVVLWYESELVSSVTHLNLENLKKFVSLLDHCDVSVMCSLNW